MSESHADEVLPVHCPRCHRESAERVESCPHCGLTFAVLDTQVPPPPPQAGHVNDFAELLSPGDVQRIVRRCQQVYTAIQAELIVVIVRSTAPLQPAEYAFWLANHWDMGGPENRGLLILLALHERRVESEVGYDLESLLSEAESEQLLQEHVVPFLRREQYGEGLYQAVHVIGKILEVKHHAISRPRWRPYRA